MKMRALAICDRCGLRHLYTDLKREWTGLFVCDNCYEEKHPQLDPQHKDFSDPKPLENPRPELTSTPPDNSAFTTAFPSTSGGGS
jgi:hypothetical protein